MSNKIVTRVITEQNYPGLTATFDSTFLSPYQGFLYYITGTGSEGEDVTYPGGTAIYSFGGSSGFINSGYVDLEYPYVIDSISVDLNPHGPTELILNYTSGPIRPDPTNGVSPAIIKADAGGVYNYNTVTTDVDNVVNLTIVGFSQGANNNNSGSIQVVNQRGDTGNNIGAAGSLTSDFGVSSGSVYGGGGFYGGTETVSGSTGPFGYSSGNVNSVNNINGTIGYAVISFIPKLIIGNAGADTYFCTSDTTVTNPSSELYLYSLLGGGGGGAGGFRDGTLGAGFGGGGGGSAMYKSGFKYITGDIGVIVGIGGSPGDGSPSNGNDGGGTAITYDGGTGTSVAAGGFGGLCSDATQPFPNQKYNNGSGGPGYYGGGQGCNVYSVKYYQESPYIASKQKDGYSLLSIPSYFGQGYKPLPSPYTYNSSNGGGYVSNSYGQGYSSFSKGDSLYDNAGGGGGGWYGGNCAYNTFSGNNYPGNNGVGYGCGGGGGAGFLTDSSNGGNGSNGYAIISRITDLSTINMVTLSLANTLYPSYFLPYKGFWFFLDGDSGLTGLNSGHFLIKEDNVRSIEITKIGTYFGIIVTFSTLLGKVQTFTMTATSPQNYVNILFYM